MDIIFPMMGGPLLFLLCAGTGLYLYIRKLRRLQDTAIQTGDDMLPAYDFFMKVFSPRNCYLPITYSLLVFIILDTLYVLVAGWLMYHSKLIYFTQWKSIWPNPVEEAWKHTKMQLDISFWIGILAIALLLFTQLLLPFAKRKLRKVLDKLGKKQQEAAKKDFLSPHTVPIKTGSVFGDILFGESFIFQTGTKIIVPYKEITTAECSEWCYSGNKQYILRFNSTVIAFGKKKNRDEAYRMLRYRTRQ